MPGPIKPKDVAGKKTSAIPEYVFEAFNALIVQHWDGDGATFTVDNAVTAVLACWAASAGGPIVSGSASDIAVQRKMIFENGWLDVEDSYRKAGWKVEFDKPGYNESYAANYAFTKKR